MSQFGFPHRLTQLVQLVVRQELHLQIVPIVQFFFVGPAAIFPIQGHPIVVQTEQIVRLLLLILLNVDPEEPCARHREEVKEGAECDENEQRPKGGLKRLPRKEHAQVVVCARGHPPLRNWMQMLIREQLSVGEHPESVEQVK